MLKKKAELILVPVYSKPHVLEVGMLTNKGEILEFVDTKCKTNSGEHHFGIVHQLAPYVVSEEEFDNIEKENEGLFAFLIGGKWTIAYCNELLGPQIERAVPVIATPEQIGFVQRVASGDIDASEVPNRKRMHECEIDNATLLEIVNDNAGECEVEAEDEFTNPEKYEDVSWGDGVPSLKLKENKIIIHI